MMPVVDGLPAIVRAVDPARMLGNHLTLSRHHHPVDVQTYAESKADSRW
jgi:hypothetical protein